MATLKAVLRFAQAARSLRPGAPKHNPPVRIRISVVIVWLAAIFAALLFGLLIAAGIYPLIVILVALIVGPLLLAYPRAGLWVAITGALIASGLIDLYLPALQPIKWGLALLATALGATTFLNELFSQPRSAKGALGKEGAAVFFWGFGFLVMAILASLANWHGAAGLLVGLKGYFQVWGLLLAIYYLLDNERDASRLIGFLLILGAIQLPFVLHQYLVLLPLRSSEAFAARNIVAGDIVAGTFGGSMTGGGRSPSLALLIVICVTVTLARFRSRLISAGRACVFSAFFFLPVFFSEVKVIAVLLPVAIFLLFQDRLFRSPLKALVGLMALVALLFAVALAYSEMPGARSQRAGSIEGIYSASINSGGYGSAVLNRYSVYPFWLDEHLRLDDYGAALIGHGPSATSSGTLVLSEPRPLARYAGYAIGLTGLSSLLWEVGLGGTFAVLALLLSAYKLGGKLAKRWEKSTRCPYIKSAQIGMALLAISLLHNNYFVFDLSFQTLFVVLLGYLLVVARIEKKRP